VEDEGGKRVEIPFARSICIAIDMKARRIEAELPEGLEDLNA
jgi:ribosomal 30S subunit maturation factor RimM